MSTNTISFNDLGTRADIPNALERATLQRKISWLELGKSTPTLNPSPRLFICKMKSTATPANRVIVRTRDEKCSAWCCALYTASAPEKSSLPLLAPSSCTHACQVPGSRQKGRGQSCRLEAQVQVRETAECCYDEHSNARTTGPSPCSPP